MEHYVKIAKKFLMRDVYEFNGIKYQFLDVNLFHKDNRYFDFHANVILESPNQSFIVEVFRQKLDEIIRSFFDFIGQPFHYFIQVDVNGQEDPYETYVRPELEEKILSKLNKEMSEVIMKVRHQKTMSFKVKYSKPEHQEFYVEHGSSLIFRLHLDLTDYKEDNQLVEVTPEKIELLESEIDMYLNNYDKFMYDVETIINNVLGSELRVFDDNIEYYLSFSIIINSINGVEVT